MESRARRELRALPNQIIRKVDAAILTLSRNPRPPVSARVVGRIEDGWRIRVGDYRIIYTVDQERRTVRI
jgi:mRNA interferase RelE/StbE